MAGTIHIGSGSTLSPVGTSVPIRFTQEDELIEMLEELPNDDQITALIGRLKGPVLRQMTSDLLRNNIKVARDPVLYPYVYVSQLSGWLATAQEAIATRGGIKHLLEARARMAGSK